MMNNAVIRRYWVLFNCLFAAFPLMKWIMLLCIAVMVIGVPIYGIWASRLGFVVGGIVLGFVLIMNTIALPYQLLSMASSKQIGFLPGVRHASFLLFSLMSLCVSIGITLLVSIKNNYVAIHEFWAISLLVSAVLISLVVIGQKYPGAQFIVFMGFWALSRVYNYVVEFHLGILLVSNFVVWLAFYRHWINWRPKIFHPNMYGMSREQLIDYHRNRISQSNYFGWFERFDSIKGGTLVGSLLLGRADGWISEFKSLLGVFVVVLVFVGYFLLSPERPWGNRFFEVCSINICMIYFLVANGLSIKLLRNMSNAWMYFDGGREILFRVMEKIYYGSLAVSYLLVFLLHAGITHLMLDGNIYGELVWVTAVFSLTVSVAVYYLNIFVYHKTKGSFRWVSGVSVLIMVALIICVATYSLEWSEYKTQIINMFYVLVAVSLPLIFILRNWVKKQWISVDLVRVKS